MTATDIAYFLCLALLEGEQDIPSYQEGIEDAVRAGLLISAPGGCYALTAEGLRHYLAHREALFEEQRAMGYEDALI